MPVGLVLIPEHPIAEHLVSLSQDIAGGSTPIMTLGDNAPGHLSIVHVGCELEEGEPILTSLSQQRKGFQVTFSGILVGPIPRGDYYVPQGGIYYGLECAYSDDILTLHSTALTLARRMGVKTIGAVGPRFRPHLTLGVLTETPRGDLGFPEPIFDGPLTFQLALASLGQYGTFPEVMQTA
jgi:hypothetical protein